jgi:hypothetical protein
MLSWLLHAYGHRSNRFNLQTMRVDVLLTDLAIVGAARRSVPDFRYETVIGSAAVSHGQAQSSDNTPTWS